MKIGLDMDEVLAQFLAEFIIFHNKEFNTTHRLEDINEFELWKVWGGTRDEISERIRRFMSTSNVLKIKPVPYAKETIEKLKKNNELFVITARHDAGRILTEKWLETHYPKTFENIHFSNDSHKDNSSGMSKAEICKSLGIDVMVEDSYTFAKSISLTGLPVILLNYSWNVDKPKSNKIHRVENWTQIPDMITSIFS